MELSMETGLAMNSFKTNLLLFTKRLRTSFIPRKINNIPELNMFKELEHLGVTLDCNSTWNPHINIIINKATNAILVC